jgi:hypothetical protein
MNSVGARTPLSAAVTVEQRSRHSPRNRHVADVLNRGSIGTVLIDLLTEEEEALDIQTAELRFDIPVLGRRLAGITDWIEHQPALKNLGLGYFGASTGAAAALVAAAERPKIVQAVVSRGGRPDLAGAGLEATLPIVTDLVRDAATAESQARTTLRTGAS